MRLASQHLLGIDPLNADEISLILDTADSFVEVGTREIKKVPTNITAGIFGFGAETYFEAPAEAQQVPEHRAPQQNEDRCADPRRASECSDGSRGSCIAQRRTSIGGARELALRHPS